MVHQDLPDKGPGACFRRRSRRERKCFIEAPVSYSASKGFYWIRLSSKGSASLTSGKLRSPDARTLPSGAWPEQRPPQPSRRRIVPIVMPCDFLLLHGVHVLRFNTYVVARVPCIALRHQATHVRFS